MIRAGLYVDSGSRSNGWAAWIGLLESAPEISPVWLDGDFVRGGALDQLDELIRP
ncbi:MAG: hypothetical protein IJ678_07825 [Kiritimatiellae bacterium]|nr:hypothetical protein [Kiritimatiellia bacterium]